MLCWSLRKLHEHDVSACARPQGRAFGVIGSDGTVSMFDSRKLQTGPFSHAVIPGPALRPSWNDMRFSANGIYIALCNSAGDVMMKDTYRMDMVRRRGA